MTIDNWREMLETASIQSSCGPVPKIPEQMSKSQSDSVKEMISSDDANAVSTEKCEEMEKRAENVAALR